MAGPTNLSTLALDEYDAVLTESLPWDSADSDRMRSALLKHFADIGDHRARGRRRDDLPFRVETHSIRVGRTPYPIFYRPFAGLVVRIVHGKRDLLTLFESEPV